MKKLLSIILCLFIVFAVCGCGEKDDSYAKVTMKDGSVETLECGEIPSLVSENVAAYNQKYAGCKVEVVTTISSIGSGYGTSGGHMVNLNYGWSVFIHDDDPVLIDLREGTKVKIVGNLLTQSYTIGDAKVTIIE